MSQEAMIFLGVTIVSGFVAMILLSRIVRWLLSRATSGATLSIVSDALAVAIGSTIYGLKHDTGLPMTTFVGYLVGGLLVLVIDLYLDARGAKQGAT